MKTFDSLNSDFKQSIKYYEVTYDKRIGGTGKLVVKALNETESLRNAVNCCFTGSNFREPVEVEEQETFAQQHPNGRCGSNRMN